MTKQIRKSDIQRIIKEEYARVLLENSGHKVTDARIRLIAEKMGTDEGLDEALGDIFRGIKGAIKGARSGASAEVEAGKLADKEAAVSKDLSALSIVKAKMQEKIDRFISDIMKSLKTAGYKGDAIDAANDLFFEAIDEYADKLNITMAPKSTEKPKTFARPVASGAAQQRAAALTALKAAADE